MGWLVDLGLVIAIGVAVALVVLVVQNEIRLWRRSRGGVIDLTPAAARGELAALRERPTREVPRWMFRRR